MKRFSDVWQMMVRVSLLGLFALTLNACDDGATGLQGPPGVATVTPSSASSLNMSIQSVTVDSPPVVVFSVGDQSGNPVAGLTADDLNFTLAKLMPGSNGDPASWQSYILTTQTATADAPGLGNTAVQATRENDGTLTDNGDGTYSYTFATDITSVTCPAPCTDAQGNALDVSYQPTMTHRLAMQTGGGLPETNVTYDFRPSDGATSGLVSRDIVANESCNECHNELEAHDGRIDVDYCVTCHNPGTTDPDSGHTVDFKVMVHKIHRGIHLPSVVGPDGEFEDDDGTMEDETADNGTYVIWGYRDNPHDYTTLGYPQDIRNCTKCHDGSDDATPDGGNWQTQISMQACGSCHDDIDFSLDGASDPNGHSGGIVTDNSVCSTCHAESRIAGSVAASHNIPSKVATEKFQYNILAICGTVVDSGPNCSSNSPITSPTVTFSVSDPTGGTHGYGTYYDVLNDPEFDENNNASFNVLTAWNTDDYTNEDGAGTRPSQPNSVNILGLTSSDITDNGDGTFTVEASATDIIPATASGSGAIALEGHPAGESEPGSGTYDIRVPVKGVVAYFTIDNPGGTLQSRRVAVDLESKCDNCHDQLSLHGNNRAENAQLCVLCHNPRGTDVRRRPKSGGIPDTTATLDGKREESIDLKRLIHAIHAGERDDPATDAVEGHGFRENGLVVWGYGFPTPTEHDFGHVRFPGILSDCTTCHNEGTYELDGTWETPTQNGILASTMESVPNATDAGSYTSGIDDQSTDLVISPTAAVCSACHDSALAQAHMETIGGAQFNVLQSAVTGSYESCSVCHGPGRSADVKVVHGVE